MPIQSCKKPTANCEHDRKRGICVKNHNIYLRRLRPEPRPRLPELLEVSFDWSFRSRLSKRLDKSKLIFCLFSLIKEDRSSCLRFEAKDDVVCDDLVLADNRRFSVESLENLPKEV